MAYKREDYNQLIRDVNEALPCIDPPLQEVDENTLIKKSLFTNIREAIQSVCPGAVFTEPLKILKQSIIDEIRAALEGCDCDCDPEVAIAEDGLQYPLLMTETKVWSNCPGYPPPLPNTTVAAIIAGQQFASPGYMDRTWKIIRKINGVEETDPYSNGEISCEGLATVRINRIINQSPGIIVFAGDCDSETTQNQLADAQAIVDASFQAFEYIFIVQSLEATCC